MATKKEENSRREEYTKHSLLRFDLKNPRFDREFSSDDEVLRFLIRNADVDELVTSMQSAGWVDFEPMIVDGDNIVLEGNRRLGALRLLTNEDTRNRLGYKIPNDGTLPSLPEKVRVRWVADRSEARAFIAFKHINGPFKWDALAKAKYAAKWLEDGEKIEKVARQIGDTHNTVLRLVNGFRVLTQAIDHGFSIDDITASRFNFSHLYTALARPSSRAFLGLSENPNTLLDKSPVPTTNEKQLEALMGWLFGQSKQGRQHVIKSQNPDLNRLVKVLASEAARSVLVSTKDFARAFEVVEPASNRFEENLSGAVNFAEKALGLVSHYDPPKQPTLMDTVRGLANTVRVLRDGMRNKTVEKDDDL
jgi:hypothetical protein